MLFVPTELRPSLIHGIGVFLLVPVKKGQLIWRFDARVDRVYSKSEIRDLPAVGQQFIKTYAHWHEGAGLYVLSGDQGSYINHSDTPNLSCIPGPLGDDAATIDLDAGTELTYDYRVTCDERRSTGQLF
jgi:uncharacterized protein